MKSDFGNASADAKAKSQFIHMTKALVGLCALYSMNKHEVCV